MITGTSETGRCVERTEWLPLLSDKVVPPRRLVDIRHLVRRSLPASVRGDTTNSAVQWRL